EATLGNPRGRVVVDDGRHFLETTRERYDVIVVDPPPPMSAAGSALLNSQEFLAAARRALQPGGLLMHWAPHGEVVTHRAWTGPLLAAFPDVVMYRPPGWPSAMYMLASDAPIRPITDAEAAVRALPDAVRADLAEWIPPARLVSNLDGILARRVMRA